MTGHVILTKNKFIQVFYTSFQLKIRKYTFSLLQNILYVLRNVLKITLKCT